MMLVIYIQTKREAHCVCSTGLCDKMREEEKLFFSSSSLPRCFWRGCEWKIAKLSALKSNFPQLKKRVCLEIKLVFFQIERGRRSTHCGGWFDVVFSAINRAFSPIPGELAIDQQLISRCIAGFNSGTHSTIAWEAHIMCSTTDVKKFAKRGWGGYFLALTRLLMLKSIFIYAGAAIYLWNPLACQLAI